MSGTANRLGSVYQLGKKCLQIDMKLHTKNRTRLTSLLVQKWSSLVQKYKIQKEDPSNVYILLEGGTSDFHGDSDCDEVFRQESFFHWTFGGLEPDWFGSIEVATGKATLFIPKISDATAVYMGDPVTPDRVKTSYAVDDCRYVEEITNFFSEKRAALILTLYGRNTDSDRYTKQAHFSGIEAFKVDKHMLHPEIVECRVHKTDEELEVMRYCNKISSQAHRHLMQSVKQGLFEYQAESLFKHYCYYHGGMRHVAYCCIGASGSNAAILHYGHAGAPNERQLSDGDMCLFDMGGEYYCYTSDITCSFPVNGKFTPDQRLIYEAVYDSSRAVIKALKPGASWVELHKLSERVMLDRLKQGGLVQGDVDDMMTARLGAIFMPHGLGHLIGCDTHDVGGYPMSNVKDVGRRTMEDPQMRLQCNYMKGSVDPALDGSLVHNQDGRPRPDAPGLSNLRMNRDLEAGMVLTVEPGCYFIPRQLSKAKDDPVLAKFLVWDVIDRFRSFGGVRIEDNLAITETGYELLTDVPRTVDEIETFMAQTRL